MDKKQNQKSALSAPSFNNRAFSVEELDDASFPVNSLGHLRLQVQESYDPEIDVNQGENLIVPAHPVEYGWTPYLIYCSLSVILGSTFIFGYNAVVINEPEQIFQDFINKSYTDRYNATIGKDDLDTIWLFTVSNFLIGGTIGALVGGMEADRFGRKKALIFNSFIGVIAGAMMFMAPFVNIFELLLIGRLIGGIHCGSISAIVPAFLMEMAPMPLRGAAGTLNQVSIVTGGFIAAVFGLPVILAQENEPNVWPFLFFPCLILPLIQIIMLLFAVESPRWLITKRNDEQEAFIALSKLREKSFARDVIDGEVYTLIAERDAQEALPKLSFWSAFTGALGWPLLICVVMQIAQQFGGINAAIYYSDSVFAQTGLKDPIPQYASLGVVFTTVITTFVSIFVIERAGRRILMLVGIGGMLGGCISITIFMTFSYVSPVFNYITIASMFIFVAAFGIGPGSIPWFIAPELSLAQYRPVTIAICTFANWVSNMTVAFAFPPIQKAIGTYSFLTFAGINTATFVFTLFFLPETKGLPAEENIQRLSLKRFQICSKKEDDDVDGMSRTQSRVSNNL